MSASGKASESGSRSSSNSGTPVNDNRRLVRAALPPLAESEVGVELRTARRAKSSWRMLGRVLLEDSRRGLWDGSLLLGEKNLMLVQLEHTLGLGKLGRLLLLLLLEGRTLSCKRLEPWRDEAGVTLLLRTGHLLLHKLSLEELELKLLSGKKLLLLLEHVGVLSELRKVDTLARLDARLADREVRKTTSEPRVGVVLVEAIRDRLGTAALVAVR